MGRSLWCTGSSPGRIVPTKRDMDMVHYVHTAAESAEGVVNDLTQFD